MIAQKYKRRPEKVNRANSGITAPYSGGANLEENHANSQQSGSAKQGAKQGVNHEKS